MIAELDRQIALLLELPVAETLRAQLACLRGLSVPIGTGNMTPEDSLAAIRAEGRTPLTLEEGVTVVSLSRSVRELPCSAEEQRMA